MTIQEIINKRVARITLTFLTVPEGHDQKANAEFLAWLCDKFPHETHVARWGTIEGKHGWGQEATRDQGTERRKSYRWGQQRHLKRTK